MNEQRFVKNLHACWRADAFGPGGKRKVFFFEKKKQKTFGRLSRTCPAAQARSPKIFASFLLFFRKPGLALPYCAAT
jgi:hypothetical protein